MCDEETKKQLEYILDQLNVTEDSQDDGSVISDEDSDENVDDDIEIEEEIDQQDPLISRADEISGFKLLEANYIKRPATMQESERQPTITIDPDDRPITSKSG